jgi:hypothetical protein
MKKLTALLLFTVLFISCKEEEKKEKKNNKYPGAIAKTFEVHGGLDAWKKAKTLSFNIGKEAHTVDLQSRKTIIKAPEYSYGFDGKEIWVSDTTAFKKDPKFYYNLYFYFYAMPFVLADDGIVYSEANPIEYKGVKYPGIKISFKENVGTSPDDNYFMYYHPKTLKMEWLKYSVTYFSKKASKKFNLIKYNKWVNVNGFQLPEELIWYKQDENGNPLEPARDPMQFTLPLVSNIALEKTFFNKEKE